MPPSREKSIPTVSQMAHVRGNYLWAMGAFGLLATFLVVSGAVSVQIEGLSGLLGDGDGDGDGGGGGGGVGDGDLTDTLGGLDDHSS